MHHARVCLASAGFLLASSLGTPAVAQSGTLRLDDVLSAAKIDSPLVGLAPATGLDDLDEPDGDLLLDETFDDFDWEFSGWMPRDFASVVESDSGGALRLEGFDEGAGYGWVLPVDPDAMYRFTRSVRFEGEPFCDFYVVESRLDVDETRVDPTEQFLAGRGTALKIHKVALEADGARWQTASTSFQPVPRTRSLVVLLRPRVGIDPGATVRAMEFDHVVLEQVFPSGTDRVRLLKAAHAAHGADPALGMRKAGWLLPLPSPHGDLFPEERSSGPEPAESNYTWRSALYAPPRTELRFAHPARAGERLSLATGLARETPTGAAARFTVAVVAEGGTTSLLDEVRTARTDDWHWNDATFDLSPWDGRVVELVLTTEAESGDPHPLWGNPRVEAPVASEGALVILIAVDTLRADHLSAYGYERATSPALEQLAADGVRFDQARSNCNWTCPSFASIFTGLVPSRHGVSSYGPATPLPDELVTLAEHFHDAGWSTHSIAYKVPLFDGNYEQGFDQAFNVPRDFIRGESNTDRALEWLADQRGGPAFLFLHFNDPHQPFVQPEPYDPSFGPSPDERGFAYPMRIPDFAGETQRAYFTDLYDGAVSYVDACIGRFLDQLRERGLYESATIAFVADHGEELWERGDFGHGGERLHDEVVRVPLIVKPPAKRFEPGAVVRADVSGFDVMPTLLELAGIEPRMALDARSLVPLMAGEVDDLGRPVVTETSQRSMSVVSGGYKLMLAFDGEREALFHLAEDPSETTDVRADEPEVAARMRELAIAYVMEHRPGTYVLAHAGDASAVLRIGSSNVRRLAGPVALERNAGDASAAATVAPNAWVLLEVEGANAKDVVVGGLPLRNASAGLEDWAPGRLASLEGPGVWRVRGASAFDAGAATPRPAASEEEIDPEVLEALKRLGYVE